MWDKNNLSFLKNSFCGDIPKDILPKQYWSSSVDLNTLPKIEIDTQNLQDTQVFDTSFSSNWKHYQETFLSIVSETIYDGRLNFFSEKICKPLINLHPFILMSTPYSLKFLKKFGFKTFHPFINEQYDKEQTIHHIHSSDNKDKGHGHSHNHDNNHSHNKNSTKNHEHEHE